MYGVLSLTLLFSGVSSLIDLGLSKAVVLLSGSDEISENQVVSSAFYINLFLIGLLSVVFIGLQLFSVDLLGSNLNIDATNKFIVLNTGFLLLILMLLNNLCRAILEANYLMHIVSMSLASYTPLLYLIIFTLSFLTTNTAIYIVLPLVITFLMFAFNLFYIRKKTKVRLIKVSIVDIKYVLKNTLGFLNIGLINSMVTPTMRYVFILMVADVGMYAIFDLSFKIAMLANSFIVSLATPMFAVFSKKIKTNGNEMVRLSFKIFYISTLMYILLLFGYYFLGSTILSFLDLAETNLDLLYNITFILIVALGSVAIVEVFYRFFMGAKQLTKAFLMKLIVPVCSVVFFLFLKEMSTIYRFMYAYGISLLISAVVIMVLFLMENKQKQYVKI